MRRAAPSLRQGLLLGPRGLLLRLMPNDCYLVPAEEFVTAKVRTTARSGSCAGGVRADRDCKSEGAPPADALLLSNRNRDTLLLVY